MTSKELLGKLEEGSVNPTGCGLLCVLDDLEGDHPHYCILAPEDGEAGFVLVKCDDGILRIPIFLVDPDCGWEQLDLDKARLLATPEDLDDAFEAAHECAREIMSAMAMIMMAASEARIRAVEREIEEEDQ